MYTIIIHILHIGCGLFWGGTAIVLHFFIFPAVMQNGPDGAKVMQTMMVKLKLPLIVMIAALFTIVFGLLLMQEDSGGFSAHWFGTNMGIALSIGGTLGIIAFFIGLFVNKPAAEKLAALGEEVAKSGNPPTPEQAEMMGKLRGRLMGGVKIIAWMIFVIIICMAGARHF